MSASLTLSSVAVAADGKTITATIGGGTGTGNAISTVAGLRPHLTAGKTFAVASASVSGSTLTVNLYSPIGTGEAVQFTITTSSTLTDSGANTPTGQTNLAMTNNSTVAVTTLDAAAAGVELSALWTGTVNMRSSAQFANNVDNFAVEFVANATDIAALCSGSGALVAVDDGASGRSPAVETASFDIVPITTASLPAGNHLVKLTPDDFYSGLRLSGGTASIVSVATTKRFMVPTATAVTGIPTTTPVQMWGAWSDRNDGSVQANYIGLLMDVQITGTGLESFGIMFNGQGWACSVDAGVEGAQIYNGDASTINVYGYVPVAWGNAPGTHSVHATNLGAQFSQILRWVRVINGTKTTASSTVGATTLTVADTTYLAVNQWVRIDAFGQREWRKITAIASNVITLNSALAKAHASGVQVTSYHAAAGSMAAWTKKNLSGKRIVAMGDSNTAAANDYGQNSVPDSSGTFYNLYDPRQSPFFFAADVMGAELSNLGVQGQTSANMASRAADIATYGRSSIDVVTIFAGTNDINGSTITPAQWKTNITTLINACVPYLRPGGIVLIIPTPTPWGVTNSGGLNFAAMQTQIAALVAAYPGVVIDGSPAVSRITLADTLSGGVHYHTSGQTKIGQDLLPLIGGTRLFVNTGAGYPFPVAAMAKG